MFSNISTLLLRNKTARPDVCTATLDAELRETAARTVCEAIRTLTIWIVPLLLVFAAVDWWILPPPANASQIDVRSLTSAMTVGLALLVGFIAVWLREQPPPLTWTNPIAFAIGLIGLARVMISLAADPQPLRVLGLTTLLICAASILLSQRWFTAYVITAIGTWYAMAYWRAPDGAWNSTWLVTLATGTVASVLLSMRRRTFAEMVWARSLDRQLSEHLSTRVRLGELLVRISARFLSLTREGFDEAVYATLKEIGHALGADHAFLCRINPSPLRASVCNEWTASAIDPKRAKLNDVSLTEQNWFFQRLLAGKITNLAEPEIPADPPSPEGELLRRLGAAAFLAVPLVRDSRSAWGYFGLAKTSHPTAWSAEEANLLHVVGDILLSTMERHHAEQRVRLSEARFRSLFDANIIGIFFANLYGTISDANDAFFEITGYQPSDLPLRWDQLTPEEWRSHDEASVLRLLKDGVDHPWEKEFLRKDGSRVPILIGGAVLSHRRGECVSFILDLSQRKDDERKIQQLNAALERAARIGTMGEMAAGLAHEVHQPIAAIANYANGARTRLSRGRLSDDDLHEAFREISQQCERAASVIRNIRDFVKGLHPERRPVDLNAVIQESLQLVRFDIHQRNVQVQTEYADKLPRVYSDPAQLSQILINLILNAVQAMEEVPGERLLTVRTVATESGFVEASIRDTGPGVSPENRDQLFDQFFTTKVDGMGLGLPIARSIAESHGGRLEVAQTGPDGTEFMLRLPATLSERPPVRRVTADEHAVT